MSSLDPYPAYKDSGVEWIGPLPEGWAVVPAKAALHERKAKSHGDDTHLTPSQTHGVLPQSEYTARTGNKVVLNLTGADSMRHVEPGDFISHLRSFQGGFEHSRLRGKVSAAYTVLTPRSCVDREFFRFLFKSSIYVQALQTTTDQLRDGQSIRFAQVALLPLPMPPVETQRAIAQFLDRETAEIDAFIADQEELIGLLTERRAATISHAVTKGLDPSAPMKDSGVSWLGDIAAEWLLTRTRFLCSVRTGSGDTVDATENGGYPFYVRSDVALRSDVYEFDGDAVLTAGDGAGVGRVFHLVTDKFHAHQRVYVMNEFRRVTPRYFFYYFSAMFAKVALDGSAKSTVDSVRRAMITDLPVSHPGEDAQETICDYLDRETGTIDAAIADAREAIALSRERRAALISAAVTGKIDVCGAA